MRFHTICDEPLTYPLVSTGDPGESGKLRHADVARSPIQAHFQPVFGTQAAGKEEPQGSEFKAVLDPKMAVAHVPAPIERRHAQGFGERQAVSFERSATQCRRTGREPGWNDTQRKGESPQPPQNEPVKGPAPRPGDCAWRRYPRPAGFGTAQQGRSESRMPVRAPVTKLWEASRKAGESGPDIGRQARSEDREVVGPPHASLGTERPRVGESGVGSNAGPICYVGADLTARPQSLQTESR